MFSNYFTQLRPEVNADNPWFSGWWQQKYDCILNVTCGREAEEKHFSGYKQSNYVTTVSTIITHFYIKKRLLPSISETARQTMEIKHFDTGSTL